MPRDRLAPAARTARRREPADDGIGLGLDPEVRLAAAVDLDPPGERLPVAEHEREPDGAAVQRPSARRLGQGREAQLADDAERSVDERLLRTLRDSPVDRHVRGTQAPVRQRVVAGAVEQRGQLLRRGGSLERDLRRPRRVGHRELVPVAVAASLEAQRQVRAHRPRAQRGVRDEQPVLRREPRPEDLAAPLAWLGLRSGPRAHVEHRRADDDQVVALSRSGGAPAGPAPRRLGRSYRRRPGRAGRSSRGS